jgi:hypothetical protein
MSLYDQMATDVAAIHAETAGPAVAMTYTPDGGAAVPLRAVFIRTGRDEEPFSDGIYEVQTAQTVIPVANVPTVTLLKDKIELAGIDGETETWYVRQVYSENPAVRELQVMKQIRKRFSAENTEINRGAGSAPRRTI